MKDKQTINLERKANIIRKEIMLFEALKLQRKYSEIEHPSMLKDDYGLQFDLNRTSISNLFNELLDRFIKNDFYIILDEKSLGYYVCRKIIDKKYKTDLEASESLHNMGMLNESVNFIKYKYDIEKIDLIDLLIESKQYDLIVKIVISDKIADDKKVNIIKRVIDKSSSDVIKIFSTIPEMYRFFECNNKGYVNRLIENNLSKLKQEKEYINSKIRKTINQDYNGDFSKFNVRDFIEFFVKFNLVNMNNINWNYDGNSISSAAAACIKDNDYLLNYLYNLPNYKDIDKDIKDTSDKVILSDIIRRGFSSQLLTFINNINFEATPDKLEHIENEILKKRKQDNRKVDKEIIEKIVYSFLRKTKKEYYKEMLKAIESLKTNIDEIALADKRKELVGVLKDLNTVLLEQVPAKTKVGSVKIIK